MITPLPKTPNVDSSVSKSLWDWLIKIGVAVNQVISWVNKGHRDTHKTGSSDALTAADIGAASATQQTWQAPTLLNSWVDFDPTEATFNIVGYYKDSLGIVHLRGMVKGGATGTVIFTLPTGYRPRKRCPFATFASAQVFTRINIDSNGNVVWISAGGTNDYVSLQGISFRAEA